MSDQPITADQQFLFDWGWRKMPTQRSKYGLIHYWDHSLHQKRNGMWWTQGDALRFQRKRFKSLIKGHSSNCSIRTSSPAVCDCEER